MKIFYNDLTLMDFYKTRLGYRYPGLLCLPNRLGYEGPGVVRETINLGCKISNGLYFKAVKQASGLFFRRVSKSIKRISITDTQSHL